MTMGFNGLKLVQTTKTTPSSQRTQNQQISCILKDKENND